MSYFLLPCHCPSSSAQPLVGSRPHSVQEPVPLYLALSRVPKRSSAALQFRDRWHRHSYRGCAASSPPSLCKPKLARNGTSATVPRVTADWFCPVGRPGLQPILTLLPSSPPIGARPGRSFSSSCQSPSRGMTLDHTLMTHSPRRRPHTDGSWPDLSSSTPQAQQQGLTQPRPRHPSLRPGGSRTSTEACIPRGPSVWTELPAAGSICVQVKEPCTWLCQPHTDEDSAFLLPTPATKADILSGCYIQ